MPKVSKQKDLAKMSKIVGELAIKYNFNFSTRLQILLWDVLIGR
jgi:hypothetical protein